MSSDLQSSLEFLQMNNYTALGTIAAVVYDYFLTFSREVQFVWRQPWSWVSAMFVLVRYVGLSWVIAADAVMIVRVYAIWNRSKRILYLLLFIYVPQVIIAIVLTAVLNTSKYLTVTISQVLDLSSCNPGWKNVPNGMQVYQVIPRFSLGAVLLILAVTQTLKQSVAMYKATKKWQLNRYIKQLVKDGVLYFLVYVSAFPSLVSICHRPIPPPILLSSAAQELTTREAQDGATLGPTALLFLTMFYTTTLWSIMSRFIISVRELYERDQRHGNQGADTEFGVSSRPIASQNGVLSAIAFADVVPGQDKVEGDANESEEIRLEPLGDNTRQV
ncbi:hypothetical protein HD554DRAFT_2175981 [Boletus coccyginus]|nr:hypothetical protein HD554DRAFT_2175981 [Boletus coccyginus]